MDKRRRQYVPLYVYFASGGTGSSIKRKFGLEGLAVWAALLAAAKREAIQGSFSWHSEADAWMKLGIEDAKPSFTFEEFIAHVGSRLHLTTTHRTAGERRTTVIRGWNEWNSRYKRQQDEDRASEEKSSTDEGNTAGKQRQNGAHNEGEGEGEGETPQTPLRGAEPLSRKELRRYTGCRYARGTHGSSYVFDPLGVDKPPADWPHERPSEHEVKTALARKGAVV